MHWLAAGVCSPDIAGRRVMAIPPEVEIAIRRYDSILRYYSFETTMYWARSHFFLVANAGLFGFTALNLLAREIEHPLLISSICIFGMCLSMMWHEVLKTGQYWTDRWEGICVSLEKDAFGDVEVMRNCRKPRHFSTKVVARITASMFVTAWAVAALYSISTLR